MGTGSLAPITLSQPGHPSEAYGPGWKNYKPNLSEAELKDMKELTRKGVHVKDGKAFEGFRYYRGLPDASGK